MKEIIFLCSGNVTSVLVRTSPLIIHFDETLEEEKGSLVPGYSCPKSHCSMSKSERTKTVGYSCPKSHCSMSKSERTKTVGYSCPKSHCSMSKSERTKTVGYSCPQSHSFPTPEGNGSLVPGYSCPQSHSFPTPEGNGSLVPGYSCPQSHCSMSKSERTKTVNGRSFSSLENDRFFPAVSPNLNSVCGKNLPYRHKNRRGALKCEHSRIRNCENYPHCKPQVSTCKRSHSTISSEVFHTFHAKGERWIERKIKGLEKNRTTWEFLHAPILSRLKEAAQKPKKDDRHYMVEIGFFHGAFRRLLNHSSEFLG
uniref:Uncharacterized protein n=1 Tax=Lobelia fervens subsp. fervens TaxID=2041125 RepID=A0A291EXG6_9ASTR|nr:hypothetical protein Lo_fe_fe1Pt0116 [Lobelia fervens subsp. fervens]